MKDYDNFWQKKPSDANARLATRLRLLLSGLACLLALAPVQAAEVYRWVDGQGQTHYDEHPRPGAERFVLAQNPETSYRVKRVYDGDTVLLENGDKVRFLGINTPEIESPRKAGEPGGEEAKRWLLDKLSGKAVRLEQDTEARDHYGRMLAHVYLGNEHINLSLVEKGLAFVDIHPPNLKHVDALLRAEKQAEQARLGLWQRPEYAARPIQSLTQQSVRGWFRLTGKVIRVEDGKTYHRLVFAEGLEASIAKRDAGLFPPLNSYLDKTLEIRGWVHQQHGHLAMPLKHPGAIRLPGGSR